MTKDFKLPDLGEGVHEGQIVRVHVKPGDIVREDQPLMEVETDKAAVEIPSPFSGTVAKVHVAAGQLVHVGDVMVSFGEASQTRVEVAATERVGTTRQASSAPRAGGASPSKGRGSLMATSSPASGQHHLGRKPASPAVRKLARSLGVDIEMVPGSGPGGRVQRADVEAATSGASPLPLGEGLGVRAGRGATPQTVSASITRLPSPRPSAGKAGSVTDSNKAVAGRVTQVPLPESIVTEPPPGVDEDTPHGKVRRVPLTQARKTIARVMAQSWSTIPHATDCDDADVTELEKLRKGYEAPDGSGRKLTMLAFVVRAVVRGLQRFPDFNAWFDADKEQVVYHRSMHIGIGVHTERGLIVPVLRDADRMSIPQISDELAVIAEKARTASFAVNDTRGGTYTISNAGAMGGSRYSTPIITPGQAAVLAIGKTRWMPWVIESEPGSQAQRGLAPRFIMPLSHSIDHRLLDGGQEIAFMQQVIGDLQNPARLLL